MLKITRLTLQTVDLQGINKLLTQQSPGAVNREITAEELVECLSNPLFYLFVVEDDQQNSKNYLGMASIFFQRNLARWIAEIHDVVVDSSHRGQGLGKLLTNELMNCALEFAINRKTKIKLYLTSRPSRLEANALYSKLGFVLVAKANGDWGTNLYKLIVEPSGFRGLS